MKKKTRNHSLIVIWKKSALSFFKKMEWQIAIKTGVAATISLVLGVQFTHWLNRPDPLVSGTWCVLSTFVVLQAHLGGTYKAAWIRFLGVLVGSFMGGIFTTILGSNPYSLGTSVIITVLILSALNLKESIRIACLSVCIVMILWGLHPEISPWAFGLFRFLDSTLGIIIAVVVAHTIWPAQAIQKLRQLIAETLIDLSRLFQLTLQLEPEEKTTVIELKRYRKRITMSHNRMQTILADNQLELLTKTSNIDDWQYVLNAFSHIIDSLETMKSFHDLKLYQMIDPKLTEHLVSIMDKTIAGFYLLSEKFKGRNKDKKSGMNKAIAELLDELVRFRAKRITSKYERKAVEGFFVFFYHLRSVIEELLKLEQKIDDLNKEPG